jgi:hypothetical protein
MLKMSTHYTFQGVILAAGLCIAGTATAQESVLLSAGPEQAQQASSEMAPVTAGIETDAGMSTAQSSAFGTATIPAPRITWDVTAPQLDAFGNETVPIFNSTYSRQ